MPWYKCSACRIRRSGLDVAISPARGDCPLCGHPLDRADDLAALMGYRFLSGPPPSAAGVESPQVPSAADTTPDAVAAARRLDEGGSNESEW